MIDITRIYQGHLHPESRLYAMFILMKETMEEYEIADDYIQPGWTMQFSTDFERKDEYYSSPYRISYGNEKTNGTGGIDYDSKHIERMEEDHNNILFLMAAGLSFNEVPSEESREILIRKYFLKESNYELSKAMYHAEMNRTVNRRISIAKQEAIEAFGFDLFDVDGNRRNISLVRKERKLLRQKLKGC